MPRTKLIFGAAATAVALMALPVVYLLRVEQQIDASLDRLRAAGASITLGELRAAAPGPLEGTRGRLGS